MGNMNVNFKTMDNVYFYDPALFPQFSELIQHHALIASELAEAVLCKTIPMMQVKKQEDKQEVVKTSGPSGAWCGDAMMDRLYEETKNTEGWLHWWSDRPDKPHDTWTIFGLMQQGNLMHENCKKCPKTVELLQKIPGIRMAGFSRLLPQSEILPHTGYTGRAYGSLAFHLGLVIPKMGCGIQVGSQVHRWRQEGEVIIFDDTFAHWAWNKSYDERIILYIDFKIPESVYKSLPPIPFIDSDDDSKSCETETEI